MPKHWIISGPGRDHDSMVIAGHEDHAALAEAQRWIEEVWASTAYGEIGGSVKIELRELTDEEREAVEEAADD